MNWKKWLLIGFVVTITIAVLIYFYKFFNLGNREFKYFTYSEFDSPATETDKLNPNIKTYFNPLRAKYMIEGSGKANMNLEFMLKLDKAREIAGVPFFITSGYRTQAYNDTLSNSVKDSAHTRGYAADISAPVNKETIIRALIAAGFNRIGEGSTFVHVDNDPAKSPYAYWTYGNAQTVINPFQTA